MMMMMIAIVVCIESLCAYHCTDHLIFLKASWIGTVDTAKDCTTPGGATHALMYVNGASWSCAVHRLHSHMSQSRLLLISH